MGKLGNSFGNLGNLGKSHVDGSTTIVAHRVDNVILSLVIEVCALSTFV